MILPTTPKTPHLHITSSPVELPGSLLLPSQGFPQDNPPITPPRSAQLWHQADDDFSDDSSVPALCVSCSSCPSPAHDGSDSMAPFSPARAKNAKSPRAAMSSRSSISTSSSGGIAKKPMTNLTAEELLDCMTDLDHDVLLGTWRLAMLSEFDRMKILMGDVCETKLDAHHQLRDFDKDMQSLAQDTTKISATYQQVQRSLESLIDRETRSDQEKIAQLEFDMEVASNNAAAAAEKLYVNNLTIRHLKQSLAYLAGVLGSWLNKKTASEQQDPNIQDMQIVLKEYSQVGDMNNTEAEGRYVRVLEEEYLSDLAQLRICQEKQAGMQKIAIDQMETIQQQSAKLDGYVEKINHHAATIQQRDHEVLLLVQQGEKFQHVIEDYEHGMRTGETTKALREKLARERADAEWTINKLRSAHDDELKLRDAEVANLKYQLSRASNELTLKTDSKTSLLHTHEGGGQLNNALRKGLGVLTGRVNSKKRQLRLPNSVSLASLPYSSSKLDVSQSNDSDGYSNKMSSFKAPNENLRRDVSELACGMAVPPRKRSHSDLQQSAAAYTKNRRMGTEPLGSPISHVLTIPLRCRDTAPSKSLPQRTATSVYIHKQLPKPPEPEEDTIPFPDFEDEPVAPESVYLIPSARAPPVSSRRGLQVRNLSPHRRVLSNIPEMSVEDSGSDQAGSDALSASDSHREALQAGLNALSRMELQSDHRDDAGGVQLVPIKMTSKEVDNVTLRKNHAQRSGKSSGAVHSERDERRGRGYYAARQEAKGRALRTDNPVGRLLPAWDAAVYGGGYLQ